MTEKILDSTHTGMTRSSSHLIPSIYGNNILELVMENGQILVREASSNKTRKTPSSNKETTIDHADGSVKKRAKLTTFSSLLDRFPTQRNSQFTSSHINGPGSCQNKNNSLKFCDEFANLRPKKVSLFKEPRMDSTHSRQDQRKGKVNNFPKFSIPAMFQTTRNASNNCIIESAKGPQSQVQGFQKQPSLSANKSKAVPAPLDEHPEAVVGYNSAFGIHKSHGHGNYCNQTSSMEEISAKGKDCINLCDEPFKLGASSSVFSLGASNDSKSSLRKNDDTDESMYFSDNDEELEDTIKETPAEEGSRVKRSRNPEIHNLSERKRRDKINNRMRALKELIPNCKEMDKASMLDYAIDYLKTLKLQLQIMSMRNGLCMALPPMMLPSPTHHHMNNAIPHLPQLMGFRGGTGFPFTPPQFPLIPPLSHMFGFSNQMPLLHVPPFIPLMGNNSSTQPPLIPENPASTSSDLHANAESSMKQAPNYNQVSLPHSTSYPFHFPTKNEETRSGREK